MESADTIWKELALIVDVLEPAYTTLNALADTNVDTYRSYEVLPTLEKMIRETRKPEMGDLGKTVADSLETVINSWEARDIFDCLSIIEPVVVRSKILPFGKEEIIHVLEPFLNATTTPQLQEYMDSPPPESNNGDEDPEEDPEDYWKREAKSGNKKELALLFLFLIRLPVSVTSVDSNFSQIGTLFREGRSCGDN
eukprot:gene22232-1307_t